MTSVHSVGVKWTYGGSLRETNFISELEHKYYSFLISNYGPKSCLSIITNSAGSSFLTSSSHKIIEQLSFGHPCFKFINALMNSQNKCHGVHGLFTGLLCSGLLLRGLKMENNIPHRVFRDVSDWIQMTLLETLQLNNCNISFKLNMEKLSEMMCVVRAIVKSKSFYLSEEECEHLSLKIIQAFLSILPEDAQSNFGHIHIIDIEAGSSLESTIVGGILYRLPECHAEELDQIVKMQSNIPLKTIIFTVPLSHETQKREDIEWSSKSSLTNSFCIAIFTQLSNLLKSKGVKVIASQMFIHDELEFLLRKEGFLVLERLGTSLTDSLIKMTQCSPISSLHDLDRKIDRHIGMIEAIEAKTIGEKHYIHIQSNMSPQDTSFILKAENIHSLTFMKESVESAVSILKEILKNPFIVSGTGCFELSLAVLLIKMKRENSAHLSHKFNSSLIQINKVFDEYIKMFLHLSVLLSDGKNGKLINFFVDNEVFHLWRINENSSNNGKEKDILLVEEQCACNCIMKSDLSNRVKFISLYNISSDYETLGENEASRNDFDFTNLKMTKDEQSEKFKFRANGVVDCFSAKLNSIRLAFNGFSELYRLGLCIYDV